MPIFIFVLVILMGLLSPVWAQIPPREIILGAVPEAPLKWSLQGRPVGIDIDIMDQILPRLGAVGYKVRFFDSSVRLLTEVETGRVDVVLSLSYNAERARYLDYPNESHVDLDWRFFIRTETAQRIRYETLDDLRGLRVGATEGFAYTPEFWAAGLNLDRVTDDSLQLRKLAQGRIDIVPMQTLKAMFAIRGTALAGRLRVLPKPLRSAPYYHAWSKQADLGPDRAGVLAQYDRLLRQMKDDGRLAAIIARYTN
jgi:polar amino acid transport system substrate-binding protein